MKYHEKCLGLLVALLVVAGCAGGSDPSAVVEEPVFADPTATAAPTSEPTSVEPTPTPESPPPEPATDSDRIDAVIAALEAEGLIDLIAWDVLEASANGDEMVTLSLCGWTGIDAFDAVYQSVWIATGSAGAIEVRHVDTSLTTGECLNTHLVESALDFIDEYELFWAEMLRYPERYADDPRGPLIQTEIRHQDSLAFTRRWFEDGFYLDHIGVDGDIRSAVEAPILYRRYVQEGVAAIEFATCRTMDPAYGTYRSSDGELFSDSKPELVGPHFVDTYRVVRDASHNRWLYSGTDGLIWADCLAVGGTWLQGANDWLPDPIPFQELPT